MKLFRPYRYPPLELVQAEQHAEPAPGAGPASQVFNQAMERGQREGYRLGLEQGERAGYEAGHAAGHADGLQAGREEARQAALGELERLAAPLDALLQQLHALHADWQSSLRQEVVELVGRVARQVVRCELALQPAQVLALVEETLAGMPSASGGQIEIYLNPSDLQRIAELDVKRPADWSLRADPALATGECRIKVGELEVDAGCKQRLAACMDKIREQLQPESAP